MLANQESLVSELQIFAEAHGGDGECGKARTILMTWASPLQTLENALEAMDDLVETVHYRALAEVEGRASRRATGQCGAVG